MNSVPMPMGGIPMGRPAFPPQGAPPLYIGNLDDTVYEEQLFSHFSKYGAIHSLKIVKDNGTGRSRGFGYINFMQARDAENARMLAQYDKIGKNPVRLMYKRNVRENNEGNIFVKNIDTDVTFKELHNAFATVGNVLTVKIATNNKGASLGYGYVQMDKREDAEKAIQALQNHKMREKEIHIGGFVPKGQRNVSVSKNLYVKGLPTNKSKDELEKGLNDLLGKYGKILSLVAQQNKNDQKWFAFVCFENADDADKCLREIHDTDAFGTGEKIYINWHQQRHERDAELRRKHLTTKNDTNLFVKNLKPETTEEAIRSAFAQFGEITSVGVRVNTVKGEEKRACGFVAFKVNQEAARAQSEGHKTAAVKDLFIEGQEPYINFWQPKQQREQYKHSKNRYNMSFRQPRPFGPGFMGNNMYPPMPMGYMRMGAGYPGNLIPPQFQRRPNFNNYPPRGGPLGPRGRPGQAGGRPHQQGGPASGPYNGPRQGAGQYNKAGPRDQSYQRQPRDDRNKRPQGTYQQQAQQPQQTQAQPTTQNTAGLNRDARSASGLDTQSNLTVQNLKDKLDDFLKLEPEKQRNILGELLFPKIVNKSGANHAPKITGMLVDFDVLTVQDILEMLEDDVILNERISEAQELIEQEGEQ